MGNYLDKFRASPAQTPAVAPTASNTTPSDSNSPANYNWGQPAADESPFKQITSESSGQQTNDPTNQQQQSQSDAVSPLKDTLTGTNPKKVEPRSGPREVISLKSAGKSASKQVSSDILIVPKNDPFATKRGEIDQQKAAKTDNIAAIKQTNQLQSPKTNQTPSDTLQTAGVGSKISKANADSTATALKSSTTSSASMTAKKSSIGAATTTSAKKSSTGGSSLSAKKGTNLKRKNNANKTVKK